VRAAHRRLVLLGLGPWALGLALAGCAARTFTPPTDPGSPLPDLAQLQSQLFRECGGVRTLQAELNLSGRAGQETLRGRVHAGFSRPASMRLEGVGPFGGAVFILVTRGETATLLLSREDRVLRGARPEEILGRLIGVSLAPADLLAILTGCVMPSPRVSAGRLHANGMASLDLEGGATLYLRRPASVWLPVAARRNGWTIEYPAMGGAFPAAVRLRSSVQGAGDGPAVDMTARLAQIETNSDLDAGVFDVVVPASAMPMTLDELREVGPLRGPQ
jgi:hypothetical protein